MMRRAVAAKSPEEGERWLRQRALAPTEARITVTRRLEH
jgi:hypothetical protein